MNTENMIISYVENNDNNDNTSGFLHFHTTDEIIFVTKGSAQFEIEGKSYIIKKNSLLPISNFEQHYCSKMTPDYKRYILQFHPDDVEISDSLLLSLFLQKNDNMSRIINFNDSESEQLNLIIKQMIENSQINDRYRDILLRNKLLELLTFVWRNYPNFFINIEKDTCRKVIYDVQLYLNSHFKENLSLQSLSKNFFTNYTYLSMKFKEYVGISFKKYLTNIRITEAKRKLLYTNSPIANISNECGFQDLTNFFKVFKLYTHTSPLQFRKKYSNPVMINKIMI